MGIGLGMEVKLDFDEGDDWIPHLWEGCWQGLAGSGERRLVVGGSVMENHIWPVNFGRAS